jgi:hypothetical protein
MPPDALLVGEAHNLLVQLCLPTCSKPQQRSYQHTNIEACINLRASPCLWTQESDTNWAPKLISVSHALYTPPAARELH